MMIKTPCTGNYLFLYILYLFAFIVKKKNLVCKRKMKLKLLKTANSSYRMIGDTCAAGEINAP